MVQRGGTVVMEVRIGDALSLLMDKHSADFLLVFEPFELLRVTGLIGKDAHIISNRPAISPFTVSLGISEYPYTDKMFARLREKNNNLFSSNTECIATKLGNIIMANIVFRCSIYDCSISDWKRGYH